jgi:hypothetical protein
MATMRTGIHWMKTMTQQHRRFLGWAAVGLSTAGCFWAFWGTLESENMPTPH